MKNRIRLFTGVLSLTALAASAQVQKKNIVEHFTNTKCSICASRNPGFYSNLNNQSGMLHLAIHPSAPYNGCLLYQQNATENDARTNYYGIYGGTPRLVINGNVVSASANYSSAGLFAPYMNQTSPAAIYISQVKYGTDSIRSRIVIKTVAQHTLGALSLFAALAEDTVFYAGSNGEPKHFDVFRKSLGSVAGINVTLPPAVGDSVVFTASVTVNPVWDLGRINTYAILQESASKNLVQAEKYGTVQLITGLGKSNRAAEPVLYPNPCKGVYFVENPFHTAYMEVRTLLGELVLNKALIPGKNEINMTEQAEGIYFVSLVGDNMVVSTGRIIVLRN